MYVNIVYIVQSHTQTVFIVNVVYEKSFDYLKCNFPPNWCCLILRDAGEWHKSERVWYSYIWWIGGLNQTESSELSNQHGWQWSTVHPEEMLPTGQLLGKHLPARYFWGLVHRFASQKSIIMKMTCFLLFRTPKKTGKDGERVFLSDKWAALVDGEWGPRVFFVDMVTIGT